MTDVPPRTAEDLPLPGGNFRLFVQKLAYQALIALGAVPNPLTGEQGGDRDRAASVLDDLEMLRDKTRGNLDPEEEEHLEEVLSNLRRALGRTP